MYTTLPSDQITYSVSQEQSDLIYNARQIIIPKRRLRGYALECLYQAGLQPPTLPDGAGIVNGYDGRRYVCLRDALITRAVAMASETIPTVGLTGTHQYLEAQFFSDQLAGTQIATLHSAGFVLGAARSRIEALNHNLRRSDARPLVIATEYPVFAAKALAQYGLADRVRLEKVPADAENLVALDALRQHSRYDGGFFIRASGQTFRDTGIVSTNYIPLEHTPPVQMSCVAPLKDI